MNIRRRVFHRRRKIENDFVDGRRLPDIGDRLANFQSELEFRARETLRRVFELNARAGIHQRLHRFFQKRNRVRGDADDLFARGVKDIVALFRRGGIVEMENDVPRAAQRLERARDQILAALAEDLQAHIIRHEPVLDEPAAKIELDLRSRRESDFDLLETDPHEHLEILELLLDAHRLGQRLVAVAKIHAAPDRGMVENAVRPTAVGQIDLRKGPVFRDGRWLHVR